MSRSERLNRTANRKAARRRASKATTVAALFALSFFAASCGGATGNKGAQGTTAVSNTQTAQATRTTPATPQPQNDCIARAGEGGPAIETMDVNKAVMVTVELDFGGWVPTIAEALREVERCYRADDGSGMRTFAVLDAYGEPTADGKLLHMSMHVSSEKPGIGMLIFKRTGKVLWRSRIQPTSEVPKEKRLTIFVDNGGGTTLTVDGSNNPPTVLEANAREMGRPLKDIWADGTEREVTFIYSACGCPVKVMAKRVGNRTVRTKETPVIFPDDPAAVTIISRLMGWS